MKCLSYEDSELIRRARRDGRDARGNEEKEKREDEKGSTGRREKRERDKKHFEDKEGLKAPTPPFFKFSRSGPAM